MTKTIYLEYIYVIYVYMYICNNTKGQQEGSVPKHDSLSSNPRTHMMKKEDGI